MIAESRIMSFWRHGFSHDVRQAEQRPLTRQVTADVIRRLLQPLEMVSDRSPTTPPYGSPELDRIREIQHRQVKVVFYVMAVVKKEYFEVAQGRRIHFLNLSQY